jgi:hypothetical protein
MEQKANIDHVNKALTEIHDELDTKINLDEIDGNMRGFENVTEAL